MASGQRLAALDVLRGFALMGIIFINIRQMVRMTGEMTLLDHRISDFLSAAVQQRFFVIFSFLFGVGFHLFLTRAEEKGRRPKLIFLRRLLILLLIGLVHHQFQPGEALLVYAIIGLLLIPFHRARASIVLAAGILFAAAGCYLGFPLTVLSMFLLGHWAGQIGLFAHTERYKSGLRIAMSVSFLSIIPFYYWQEYIFSHTGMVDVALAVGGLPVSVFYVSALTLLMQQRQAQRILSPLGAIGRMALTNYLMQTAIILIAAHLLRWQGTVHAPTLAAAAACILVLQMIASTVWLRYFRMGPAEYLWRWGTYGRRPELRKGNRPS